MSYEGKVHSLFSGNRLWILDLFIYLLIFFSMKIIYPESMFHMLLRAACVLMALELTANSHRYCMYSCQLLSLTDGIDHVWLRLLFSTSSLPMHMYRWKDHIILILEHGKCHLLSMYI